MNQERPRKLLRLVVFAVAVFSPTCVVCEPVEVYRRATVLEDRIGRIYVRATYGARLTDLTPCETNRRGCLEERVYADVLSLEFASEHRHALGDEVIRTEEPAGTILIGVGFSQDGLDLFRQELFDRLRRLSAQAFIEPFAGWQWRTLPFESAPTSSSELPTWACFDSGGGARATRYSRPHDDDGVSRRRLSSTYSEPPTPICDEMSAATEGALPEIIETLPVPIRLREEVVYHEDANRIDTTDPDLLAAFPEGVWLFKREMPGGVSGTSSGSGDGIVYASVGRGGRRFEAYAQEAFLPIDALDDNAWLHRWRIETVERQLGPDPGDRVTGETVVVAAYLPTLPPLVPVDRGDDSGSFGSMLPIPEGREVASPGPAKIDSHAYVDAVVDRLHRHHGSPEELIESTVVMPPAGLESDGWIVVLCHEDGSATYHLPPTGASNRVLNADLFCAAAESRLGP